MPPRALCLLPVVLVSTLVVARGADDVAGVKEKLFQAKKEYDGEMQKFRKAVGEALDKREADARKAGNKKLVDQVKSDRDRFDKTGEPPAESAPALKQLATARSALDKAYQAAVRDYLKLKADDDADAAEKERQQFLFTSAFVVGKRTHLTGLKPFDIRAWNNWF